MPDLEDLHNTLAAKRQERKEALAKAEAALQAEKEAAGADFILAQIAQEEALIESLGSTSAPPAPKPPAPPAPPAPVDKDVI